MNERKKKQSKVCMFEYKVNLLWSAWMYVVNGIVEIWIRSVCSCMIRMLILKEKIYTCWVNDCNKYMTILGAIKWSTIINWWFCSFELFFLTKACALNTFLFLILIIPFQPISVVPAQAISEKISICTSLLISNTCKQHKITVKNRSNFHQYVCCLSTLT